MRLLPGHLLALQPTQRDFPEFVSIPIRVARNAERARVRV